METIIKVSPSELNESLLDKIRAFIDNKNNIDVTISLKEFDAGYADELDNSIRAAENEADLVSFTMEDFMNYAPAKNER